MLVVCDFTIKTLHFSSCVIFNSFQALKLLNCLRLAVIDPCFSPASLNNIGPIGPPICQHHEHCGNLYNLVYPLLQRIINHSAKLFLSSGLVKSSAYNITNQYIVAVCDIPPCSAHASSPLKPNLHCYVSNQSSPISVCLV